MSPFHPNTPGFLPSTVLFVLGLIDLVRGLPHTFLVNWAARTFAKLDLSVARQDQLTLLGTFGISNFLTGAVFLLISSMAPSLSPYVLLAVPCTYVLGVVGLKPPASSASLLFAGAILCWPIWPCAY